MRRRDFITLIGGATVGWPCAASAQMSDKLRTIVFLGPNASEWSSYTAAFEQRLSELGWVDRRTIAIRYRWTEGRTDRLAVLTGELAGQRIDVIVTYGRAAVALKRETTSTPIVSAITVDPLRSGLVTNLAHPDANVTGLSIQATDIAGKRLSLLHDLVPGLHRLAVVFDPTYPAALSEFDNLKSAARTIDLKVMPHEVRHAEEFAPVFDALKGKVDAVSLVETDLIAANTSKIAALALEARLPTSFNQRGAVDAGGLMSYGPNYTALFQRSADFVDKILRGTKPADIPWEQPSKFELVINRKTARSLGLTIPPALLATADDVIE